MLAMGTVFVNVVLLITIKHYSLYMILSTTFFILSSFEAKMGNKYWEGCFAGIASAFLFTGFDYVQMYLVNLMQ